MQAWQGASRGSRNGEQHASKRVPLLHSAVAKTHEPRLPTHPTAAQKDTPQPTDADVKVVEYDSITVYVRVFSGFATEGALGQGGVACVECWAHASIRGTMLCLSCAGLDSCAAARQSCLSNGCPTKYLTSSCSTAPPPPSFSCAGTIVDETRSLHEMLTDDDRDFATDVVWAAGEARSVVAAAAADCGRAATGQLNLPTRYCSCKLRIMCTPGVSHSVRPAAEADQQVRPPNLLCSCLAADT